MKKIIKIILITLLILIASLLLWILIEFVHFKVLSYDKPIVTLDEIFCSPDSITCYGDDEYYTHIYYGIGFSVRLTYHLNDRISNKFSTTAYDYTLVKREFYPFNYDY